MIITTLLSPSLIPLSPHLNILTNPRIPSLLKPIIRIPPKRLTPLRTPLPMRARSLPIRIRLRKLLLHSLISSRQEDNLAISRLRHRLHSLQVPNLHSWRGAQNVGGLAHQFCGLDFSAGGDDFGFTDTFALCGHGEGVLEFGGEDDVFDEHAFDLDTPARGDVFDDFPDGLGDFFAAFDDVLEDAGTDDVAEGGLGAFDEGLADIGDAEGGFVGGGDVVVDHGGELEVYVVFGHADLFRYLCNTESVGV